MSIVLSLVPGAMLYGPIADVLHIPTGIHNIVGVLCFGLIYTQLVVNVFRKPFTIAQEFAPIT